MALIRLVDGEIVWSNQRFNQVSGMKQTLFEQKVSAVLPAFTTDWLAAGKTECPYDLDPAAAALPGLRQHLSCRGAGSTLLGTIYLADLTELYQVRDEYIRSRPVVSIILVDNYDELTKNLTESAISTLNAELNEVITRCTEGYHGLLRLLERNRFLFVFELRDLKRSIESKFPLLEEIRRVVSPTGVAATISLGIGRDGASFEESYNFAALSMEMALSRGGDQAVIKDRYNFSFYGGRTKGRRTTAQGSLPGDGQFPVGADCPVQPDFCHGPQKTRIWTPWARRWAFAACAGKKGKKAKIVLDLEQNAAGKLLEQLTATPEYADAFLSGQDALLLADAKSL